MYIATLMDEKVNTSGVSLADLLSLQDDPDEIYEWLSSECWPLTELFRLVDEIALAFFGDQGVLDEDDYEDFRFILQIMPDQIDDMYLMEAIEESLPDDTCVDPEGYALFLEWLAREEITILPGGEGRTFEYALATGPVEALEYYLMLADATACSELMLTLARTNLYKSLGDAYFAALLELGDNDLTMAVFQILSDKSQEQEDEITEMEELLAESHQIVMDLCEKAGVDYNVVYAERLGNVSPDDGDEVPADPGLAEEPADAGDAGDDESTCTCVPSAASGDDTPPIAETPPEEGPGATPAAET